MPDRTRNRLFTRLAASLCLLPCLTACEGMSRLFVSQSHDSGLTRVDGLLDGIERTHVDTVLCQQRAEGALEALRGLVAPDFGGDPLAAYSRFVDAVERAEAQAEQLQLSIGPMDRAADLVFQTWRADLVQFVDPTLKEHSEERLAETEARYDAIGAALEPALAEQAAFHGSLRDMVLFLGHDFNAAAVAGVSRELDGMTVRAQQLVDAFADVQLAAQAYVQSAALPGETDLARMRVDEAGVELQDELEALRLEEARARAEAEAELERAQAELAEAEAAAAEAAAAEAAADFVPPAIGVEPGIPE